MTLIEYQEKTKEYLAKYKEAGERIKSHIHEIQSDFETTIIKYPRHKEAFHYVQKLFPSFIPQDVVVYSCKKKLMDKLGYEGVGGFFEKISKTIVIPKVMNFSDDESKEFDISVKVSEDEVLVHELLHYVSDGYRNKIISVEMEEEFAYGNSIGYLRGKGYSDEQIVKNNFLPFFFHIGWEKAAISVLVAHGENIKVFCKKTKEQQNVILTKYKKEIHEVLLVMATEKSHKLIEVYTRERIKPEDINVKNCSKDFSFLDI